jgi:hypothetical protein
MRATPAILLVVILLCSTLAAVPVGPGAGAAAHRVPGVGGPAILGGPSRSSVPLLPAPRPHPRPELAPYVTVIEPNGTITNSSAPISRSGETYSLLGDLSGALIDERNGSRLQGAGFAIDAPFSAEEALSVWMAARVSISNITLNGAAVGLYVDQDEGVSVATSQLNGSGWGLQAWSTDDLGVQEDSFHSSGDILLDQVSSATIFANNLQSASDSVEALSSAAVTIEDNNASSSATGVLAGTSEDLTIEGNVLSETGTAVEESQVSVSNISHNTLNRAGVGLSLADCANVSAFADAGQALGEGILVSGGSSLSFSAQSFQNTSIAGVIVQNATNVSLWDSDLSGSAGSAVDVMGSVNVGLADLDLSAYGRNGVTLGSDLDVRVTGTRANNARSMGSYAIASTADANLYLADDQANGDPGGMTESTSSNLTLFSVQLGSTASNASALVLQTDHHVTIEESTFTHAGGVAFLANGVDGLEVVTSFVSNAGLVGMRISNSTSLYIAQNYAEYLPGPAIDLENDQNANVLLNHINNLTGPASAALRVDNCSGTSLVENNITGVPIGLQFIDDLGTQAVSNNVSSSGTSFAAWSNVNLSVIANQFWFNAADFTVVGNVGAVVYHNNFVSGRGWTILPPILPHVVWDAGFPHGGNYWSNHTGPDVETGSGQNVSLPQGDGIVDTPVILSYGEEDRYPLALPWTGYAITFSASGFYSPSVWTVVINGVPFNSTSATITYDESDGPNSTFSWYIPPLVGYSSATPSSGSGVEERVDATVPIQLVPVYYALSFQEVGLAAGTIWTMVAAGTQSSSNSSTMEFQVHNGTYNYVPGAVPGYLAYGGSGVVTVAGGASVVTVYYEPLSGPGSSTSPAASPSTSLMYGLVGALVVITVIAIFLGVRRPPARPPPVPFPPPGAAIPTGPAGASPPDPTELLDRPR